MVYVQHSSHFFRCSREVAKNRSIPLRGLTPHSNSSQEYMPPANAGDPTFASVALPQRGIDPWRSPATQVSLPNNAKRGLLVVLLLLGLLLLGLMPMLVLRLSYLILRLLTRCLLLLILLLILRGWRPTVILHCLRLRLGLLITRLRSLLIPLVAILLHLLEGLHTIDNIAGTPSGLSTVPKALEGSASRICVYMPIAMLL
jgi:hypothetical protein